MLREKAEKKDSEFHQQRKAKEDAELVTQFFHDIEHSHSFIPRTDGIEEI